MTIQLLIVPSASLPAEVLEVIARKAKTAGLSTDEFVARLLKRAAEEEEPHAA